MSFPTVFSGTFTVFNDASGGNVTIFTVPPEFAFAVIHIERPSNVGGTPGNTSTPSVLGTSHGVYHFNEQEGRNRMTAMVKGGESLIKPQNSGSSDNNRGYRYIAFCHTAPAT